VPALRGDAERLTLRIYTSDVDVTRLVGETAIQALGEICDVELRGVAPDPASGVFAGEDVLGQLREFASAEAARSGQRVCFLGAVS
jgi:hypothetical protein